MMTNDTILSLMDRVNRLEQKLFLVEHLLGQLTADLTNPQMEDCDTCTSEIPEALLESSMEHFEETMTQEQPEQLELFPNKDPIFEVDESEDEIIHFESNGSIINFQDFFENKKKSDNE